MRKNIYSLLLLVNVLITGSVSGQKHCYSNYTIDSITYSPVQAYDIGTPMSVVRDSFSTVIPLGFTFNFYGIDYTSVLISPNGYLCFDTSRAGGRSDVHIIPSIPRNIAKNSIFLFMTDLQPETVGTIKYSTIGISPNRQFVVSYDSVLAGVNLLGPDTNVCTGQIVLYETTNIIEMYLEKTGLELSMFGATEGVQNNTGTVAAAVTGRNGTWYSYIRNDGRRFTETNIAYPASSPICMVGVDSASNKNMVIWNKPAGFPIDSFVIYRESNTAGIYSPIGRQAYSDLSTFIDMSSNPAQKANRYKLRFVDSCGVLSALNPAHKTVHLTINQGSGNTWNLIWDAYEGFSFGSYNLYRGTTASNMTWLTDIASNLYSYTDLDPPLGTVYYMIEVVNPNPCSPARVAQGGNSFNSSFSNIVTDHILGLSSVMNASSVRISPNPAASSLTIHSSYLHSNDAVTVSIMNLVGEAVQVEMLKWSDDAEINITALSSGIYFLQIKSDSGVVTKRFVKA